MSNEKSWQHIVHYSILHDTNCLSNPDVMINALRIIRDTFNQLHFNSITIKYIGRHTASYLKPLNRNWVNIEKKIREARIESVILGVISPNGRNFEVGVVLSLFQEQFRRENLNSNSHDHISIWVDRSAIQENTVSLQACNSLIESLWQVVSGVYGRADYFISHETGLFSDHEMIAMSQEFAARHLTSEEINPYRNFRQEILVVYWLNLLNGNHVKRLMEHGVTREDLEKFTTRELANGGLEIQLSETPFMANEQDYIVSSNLLKKMVVPLLHR